MKKLAAALMCGTMTMSLFATAQAGETGSEQKDVAQEAIDARKEEAEKTGEYQKILFLIGQELRQELTVSMRHSASILERHWEWMLNL